MRQRTGTQLIRQDVGRLDEQQPVSGGIEHANGRCPPVRQPADDARERVVRTLSLVDAALETRLAGNAGRHLRRGDTVRRDEQAHLAADSPPTREIRQQIVTHVL